MIRTECVLFLSMMAGGCVAALVATILLTLGRASRVARVVFDLLTPLAVGAIFFYSLYLASDGVFRLYALLAFLLGGGLFRRLYRLVLPWIKKAIAALSVPIKSLENAISERLAPIRERRMQRRQIRAEKRARAREERRALRLAERERRACKRRVERLRRKARAEEGKRGRYASSRSAMRQSH